MEQIKELRQALERIIKLPVAPSEYSDAVKILKQIAKEALKK